MAPAPTKKKSKQTPTKKKNSGSKKKRHPAWGGNISWGAKTKKVKSADVAPMSFQKKIMLAAALFVAFMIALYVFVDDAPKPTGPSQHNEAVKNDTVARKEFSFEHAVVINSTSLVTLIETQSEERLVVVTFDDSTQNKETDGKATRLRMFRRMEALARSLPRKKVFKVYEEEELPLICLFDCGDSSDAQAEDLCTRIVGKNRPGVVIYSNKQARPLPSEHRSDKQVVKYLYDLMQPAVKYLEERGQAEEFATYRSDDVMNVIYFGDDSPSYTKVADSLRDFANFGRVKNPQIAQTWDLDEQDLPAMAIWRTFGENPLLFPTHSGGNISNGQQLSAFVLNNFLPLCGEFTAKTQPKYMKRGLPVAFVIVDKGIDSDQFDKLTNEVATMSRSYLGAVSFATLDANDYPQLVENIGINLGNKKDKGDADDDESESESESDEEVKDEEDENEDKESDVLPQIAIHVQNYQKHGPIDLTDVRGSVFEVVDGYVEQLRREQQHRQGSSDGGTGEMDLDGTDDVEEDELDEDEEEVEPDPFSTDEVSAPKVEV